MKKYDLLRSGNNIMRILDIQDDRILMIDCVKHTMPVWRKFESVDSVLSESELLRVYFQCSGKDLSVCTANELLKTTGFTSVDIDILDAGKRKVMYERYTMIAPILPFFSDDKIRSKLICSIAEGHKVSKQTVRNYLCLYLSYLDVTILAPKKRKIER